MEPKKNPKADLTKKSVLFLQLGLILVLFITWRGIEWKTYDRGNIDIGQVNLDELDEEDVPITQNLNTPPPPPPPPPAPEIIDVVEDEEEVEETIIESTETNQEEEIVEIEEVEDVDEEEEIADVPFAVIENVPIFPGCEKAGGNAAKKKCMSDKVKKFVNRKFNTELGSELGLSGVNRIYVRFKIDKNGNIVGVQARGPHPRLEKEAQRVVKLLPKMTPGRQRGKAVGVLYSLPIVFQVQD
ncbi:energy transducer TonB [Aquimarina sp. 2201CG5-10]|uniref:energy transducer TonB n=1 Tax=Aquimarina callyspongiae TaxID=3098150 RepID=UPI002AB5CFC3|nr:energy transducer TonB [Aquimarina sp. 2201CG5-10]MDY8136702.1 energy transducer TonB [Aquimarina sp. 2201CG5-10]